MLGTNEGQWNNIGTAQKTPVVNKAQMSKV
jgi:hypothetical protein